MKTIRRLIYLALMVSLITGLFGYNSICYGVAAQNADDTINSRLKGAVVLYSGSMYALVDNSLKVIDSKNELITPFFQNNKTMAPIRFIAESFGAKVSWNQKTQIATIESGKNIIKIKLYSTSMTVNGKAVKLEVPAMATGDRTFIPLRAVGEALGKEVFYDRGLVVVSDKTKIFDTTSEKNLIDKIISKVNILPNIGTREKLKELLEKIGAGELYRGDIVTMKSAEKSMAPTTATGNQAALANGTAASQDGSSDYSKTNVQVSGVDEADMVKTDGEYIYQVSNNKVLICEAYPADNMAKESVITFSNEQFAPAELYIKGDKLVIIGSSSFGQQIQENNEASSKVRSLYPNYDNMSTKAYIYDVTDRKKPVKLREVSLQGNYVSSRLIGNDLYLISNHYIYNWQDETVQLNPQYKDSVIGPEAVSIPYDKIRYMPPVAASSYLLVAGLSLDGVDKPMNVSAYLGAGENIYVSLDNLYVSVNEGHSGIRPMLKKINGGFVSQAVEDATLLYKFSLKASTITYLARGQAPGTILNQFSMDENGGKFRIATTTTGSWVNGTSGLKNNVYIFDENMNMLGKLEDLAKGEKIYSVRFMGNRAYIVTFKTVDPLFAINLADPKNPTVLGTLKIPGYSNYLHPYDENHIIGFGKDTMTVSRKDSSGAEIDTTAYYLGMKVALFDVSNVLKPVEEAVIKIGDRGTDSELLTNHKALLFDKEKQLLAFPVNEAKVDGPVVDPDTGYPNYGQIVFSGAYVYKLNLEDGFVLKGKISHLTLDDYLKSGYYDVDYSKQIKRMLYIGDVLYGVSESKLSAHDMNSLKELNTVEWGN